MSYVNDIYKKVDKEMFLDSVFKDFCSDLIKGFSDLEISSDDRFSSPVLDFDPNDLEMEFPEVSDIKPINFS